MGSRNEEVGRHCPYCGAMVSSGEHFCRSCHKKFSDQNEPEVPSSRQSDTYVVAVRKTWLAAILSITGVGLGQFYNGDTLKGLAFGFAFIFVSFGIVGGKYRIVLFFGIWILAIVEALLSARHINRYERSFGGVSYLLYAELAVLAGIVMLHLYTGLPDMDYLMKLFPVLNLWGI